MTFRICLSSVGTLVFLSMSGCFFVAPEPVGEVACERDEDCQQQLCHPVTGRCVAEVNEDRENPSIESISIAPAVARKGTVVALQVTVSEPLERAPTASFLTGGQQTRYFEVIDGGGPTDFEYRYEVNGTEGDGVATAAVVAEDDWGNVGEARNVQFTIDTIAPRLVNAMVSPGFVTVQSTLQIAFEVDDAAFAGGQAMGEQPGPMAFLRAFGANDEERIEVPAPFVSGAGGVQRLEYIVDANDIPPGVYTVEVDLVDDAGNVATGFIPGEVVFDYLAPELTEPAAVQPTLSGVGRVDVGLVFDDLLATAPRVEARDAEGQPVHTFEQVATVSPSVADFILNVTPGMDGTYSLFAAGIEDRAGNVTASLDLEQVLVIDTTAPEIIDIEVSSVGVQPGQTLTAWVTVNETLLDTPTVTYGGIAMTNAGPPEVDDDGNDRYTFALAITEALALSGTFRVLVGAVDLAENATSAESVDAVAIDTVAPEFIEAFFSPEAAKSGITALLTITTNEPLMAAPTFCWTDRDNDAAPCADNDPDDGLPFENATNSGLSWTFRLDVPDGLADQSYALQSVTFADEAGNVTEQVFASGEEPTFSVDSDAPDIIAVRVETALVSTAPGFNEMRVVVVVDEALLGAEAGLTAAAVLDTEVDMSCDAPVTEDDGNGGENYAFTCTGLVPDDAFGGQEVSETIIVEIEALDAALNGTIETGLIRLDTAAPTVAASATTPSPARCEQDVLVTFTTDEVLNDQALSAAGGAFTLVQSSGTTYTYRFIPTQPGTGTFPVSVTLTDAVGNTGTRTLPAVELDCDAPVITVTQPPDQYYSAQPGRTDLSFTVSTDDATDAVSVTLPGADVPCTSAGTAWTCALSSDVTTALSDGTYIMRLDVVDVAGNVTSESFVVVVDTAPPDLSTSLSSDVGTTGDEILYSLASNEALATISLVADADLAFGEESTSSNTAFYRSVLTASVAQGPHPLSFEATDLAGNPAVSPSSTLTVDRDAPRVETFALSEAVVSANPGFNTLNVNATLGAGENAASLEIFMNETPLSCPGAGVKTVDVENDGTDDFIVTCTTATLSVVVSDIEILSGMPGGSAVVRVEVTDAAGNFSVRSTSFIVDKLAPGLSVDQAVVDLIPEASNPLDVVTAVTNGTEVRVLFSIDEPVSTDPLVEAIDAAGNRLPIPLLQKFGQAYLVGGPLLPSLNINDGIATVQITLVDDVGNEGVETPLLSQVIDIDRTPPNPLLSKSLLYVRAPHGVAGSGVAGKAEFYASVESGAGAEPGAHFRVRPSGENTTLVIGAAPPSFPAQLNWPGMVDWAAVDVEQIDTAGNISERMPVGAVQWHGVRKPGAPHTTSTSVLAPAYPAAPNTDVDAESNDGKAIVRGGPRMIRRTYAPTSPPNAKDIGGYDPARGRFVLLQGGSPTSTVWEFDGVEWTSRAPVTSAPYETVVPAAGVEQLFFDEVEGQLLMADTDGTVYGWDGVGFTFMAETFENVVGGAYVPETGETLLFSSPARMLLWKTEEASPVGEGNLSFAQNMRAVASGGAVFVLNALDGALHQIDATNYSTQSFSTPWEGEGRLVNAALATSISGIIVAGGEHPDAGNVPQETIWSFNTSANTFSARDNAPLGGGKMNGAHIPLWRQEVLVASGTVFRTGPKMKAARLSPETNSVTPIKPATLSGNFGVAYVPTTGVFVTSTDDMLDEFGAPYATNSLAWDGVTFEKSDPLSTFSCAHPVYRGDKLVCIGPTFIARTWDPSVGFTNPFDVGGLPGEKTTSVFRAVGNVIYGGTTEGLFTLDETGAPTTYKWEFAASGDFSGALLAASATELFAYDRQRDVWRVDGNGATRVFNAGVDARLSTLFYDEGMDAPFLVAAPQPTTDFKWVSFMFIGGEGKPTPSEMADPLGSGLPGALDDALGTYDKARRRGVIVGGREGGAAPDAMWGVDTAEGAVPAIDTGFLLPTDLSADYDIASVDVVHRVAGSGEASNQGYCLRGWTGGTFQRLDCRGYGENAVKIDPESGFRVLSDATRLRLRIEPEQRATASDGYPEIVVEMLDVVVMYTAN